LSFPSEKIVDSILRQCYNPVINLNSETVEAEIKAAMPPQRARGAENRARNTLSNGPLRAQSKAYAEYSATRRHASVAEGMLVPCQAHGAVAVNQGGTADKIYSSLTEEKFLSGAFCFPNSSCQRLIAKPVSLTGGHDDVTDETMAKAKRNGLKLNGNKTLLYTEE